MFVDLDNAYDKVPREEVRYCMRKSGLAEKYVMYDDRTTAVRCAVGVTEGFEVHGAASRIGFEPLFVCNGDG